MTAPYEIILSMQRALLGMVTSNLRATSVEETPEGYLVRFYYVHEPTEGEVEDASVVVTEFGADFPEAMVDWQIVVPKGRIDPPKGGVLAYRRAEEGLSLVEPVLGPFRTERGRCASVLHQLMLGRITENMHGVSMVLEGGILAVILWYYERASALEQSIGLALGERLSSMLPDFEVSLETRKAQQAVGLPYPPGSWLVFERAPGEAVNRAQ